MRLALSSMHTKWGSRVLLPALALLASNLAAAASPTDQEKTDAKGPPASFRAFLPTIRLKALLDNERQSVADLVTWLRRYDVWLDTDYRDSLDQFTSRFRISEERRRQMEVAATAPLAKVFQRFEEFSRDTEAAFIKPLEMGRAEDVAKVRPELVKILTESALVKNTTLPKRFLKRWDEWKKIDDRRKLLERITKNRKDLRQLRERRNELAEKQQELPDAERQRMETLKFDLDLGEFQLALFFYEKQEWKNVDDEVGRLKRQREVFFSLIRTFRTLLDHAYVERFNHLVQSWPELAPVKIKDVDLLACKLDKAEEAVASLLKTPDAQLAGRKKIRHLRILAESYPIQQRLFQLAFVRREDIKEPQISTSPPAGDLVPEIILPGLIGPVRQRPELTNPPWVPEPLLKTEASFAWAKRHLLQTWIDYQMVRLDLYGDLGLPPPDR